MKVNAHIVLFFVLMMIGNIHAQEYSYSIEHYSYESGFKDNFIVEIDISKDNDLYVANRQQVLKNTDGGFVEIFDLKGYPNLMDMAVDVEGRVWLLFEHFATDEVSKKIVLLDSLNYNSINVEKHIENIDLLNSISLNGYFKDENHNLFLNSIHPGDFFSIQYEEESNCCIKRVHNEVRINEHLVIPVNYQEKLGDYANVVNDTIIETRPIGNHLCFASDPDVLKQKLLNIKENCYDSGCLYFLNKSDIIESTNVLEDYSNAKLDTDHMLIFDQQHAFYKSSDEQTLIEFHELFPSYFESSELLNVIIDDNVFWLSTSDGLLKITRVRKLFETFLSGRFIQTRNIISTGQDTLLVASEYGTHLIDLKTNESRLLHPGYSYGLFQGDNNRIYSLGELTKLHILYSLADPIQKEYLEFRGYNDVFFHSGFWLKGQKPIIMSKSYLHEFDIEKKILNEFDGVDYEKLLSQLYYINSTLFLCTSEEVLEVDLETKGVKKSSILDGLIHKNVSFLHIDTTSHHVWLCTKGSGLIKWDYKKKEKKTYGLEEGFLSLNIHSIYPDSKNRFWMSTDFGISVMDRNTEEIVTLTHENGLHQNEMNRHSSYFLEDSVLFFGSIDGIIKFEPNSIDISFNEREIEIDHLEYRNGISSQSELIKSEVKDFEITIKERYINPVVYLSTVENTFYNKIRYRFQNSQNPSWIKTESGKVPLSDMAADDVLLVSSQIGLNKWTRPKAIRISIQRPFYKSLTFYVTLAGLITIGLLLWSLWSSYLSEKRAKLIKQKVNVQTAELSTKILELTKSKNLNDQIFSIIGHDLKSPLISLNSLNKSIGYLIDKKEYDELKKLGRAVETNSQNVLNVVERLLDWSGSFYRSELNVEDTNIYQLTENCIEEIRGVLTAKQVNFVNNVDKDLELHIIKESLQIVLRNLLSNAYKFSHTESDVIISSESSETVDRILVEDFGIGIPDHILRQINLGEDVRSKTGTQGEKGLGLGLRICRELCRRNGCKLMAKKTDHEGTLFIVEIPKHNAKGAIATKALVI